MTRKRWNKRGLVDERPWDNEPREGERIGAAGWCTACGRAWEEKRIDGQVVCRHCEAVDDQDDDRSASPNTNKQWRKRQIILEPEIVERLYSWNGGQGSYTYSLASTGNENLVSLSMIDATIDELSAVENQMKRSKQRGAREDAKDVGELVGDLEAVRQSWREHSAKEAGMEDEDFEYEYDKRDYGYSAEEEADIRTTSG